MHHPRSFSIPAPAALLAAAVLPIAIPGCGTGRPVSAEPDGKGSVVRLERAGEGYRLLRNGRPFLIKGAGGQSRLDLLAAGGGNSIRTWGTDNLGAVLDDAHRQGIAVTAGIWLGHRRHGFRYDDPAQVKAQYERAREAILRYRGHPALLMWGIGNEMEGYEDGGDPAVWRAVNDIAALAKELDENHPTMTVVAEVGGQRVPALHRLCPAVDVVGVNSYGGGPTVADRYRKAGGTKPFVLTEFGPPGAWETAKNAWGAAPELTSTEKAERYRDAYRGSVLGSGGLCLGSYAFLWGHKQEATATWFGMFLPDGSRLGAVDVLTELWSGRPPANRCPEVRSLKLAGPGTLEPGAVFRAFLDATDPDSDSLKVEWVLQREPAALGTGGDAEAVPPTFPDALVSGSESGAELRAPRDGGGYRLFAYVRDGRGGAATASVPVRVNGPVSAESRPSRLPLVLYGEGAPAEAPYTPSGWMGNTKAIRMDPECTVQPHAGKTCLRAEYAAADNWAGVVWQSPVNDWGERPGGWDLTGATALTFWARGETGEETVTFQLGLLGGDKRYFDTASGKLENVRLGREWKQYRLDLSGKDLKRVKTGFAWVAAGKGRPTVFYLDDIRYE